MWLMMISSQVEVWQILLVFFFKQKTAYEMRISDWSSDVCSSDLALCRPVGGRRALAQKQERWNGGQSEHHSGKHHDIRHIIGRRMPAGARPRHIGQGDAQGKHAAAIPKAPAPAGHPSQGFGPGD